jgi:rhomboid protease GluP
MSRLPPVILALIAANAAVFAWELSAGVLESEEGIIGAGALVRSNVLDGELWRLLSSVFLHGSFDHLLGNCVVLYVLGMAADHLWGRGKTFLIYVAAGLGGAVLSTAMSPGPSVGASGAIFGLLGGVAVSLHRSRHLIQLRDNRLAFVLAAWGIYQMVTGFLTPLIDNFAHIGGLLSGAGLAAVVRPTALEERVRAWRRACRLRG